jgi:glycosyltransferase involved in cell wall biosynthesis
MKNIVDNHFVIISPVYNVLPYIEKCIMSVMNQSYKNFEYIVIEDCSTDGTREKTLELQAKHGFNVCYNPIRTESPLGNFVKGIGLSPGSKDDIIVTVDGDDWLIDDTVLEYLNEVYQDPSVWMTYGSFVSSSGKIAGMCKQLLDTRNYRRLTTWVTSHLRTIKRKLWVKIKDGDLKDYNGNYYVYYPDTAYMFPAIEMAGLQHSKFIEKVLYVYNDRSPLCSADDWKNFPERQREICKIAKEIRLKRIYPELIEL